MVESDRRIFGILKLLRLPNYQRMAGNSNPMVLEVHARGIKRWIKLEVTEPVTITAKEFMGIRSTCTTYLIRIETNHYAFSLPYSEVRRRYSEFCWLRAKLAYHHPNKDLPPLPPKKYLHLSKYDTRNIEQRRAGLGKFLQRVMRSSVFLSDSALHWFLQSNLSVAEIELNLAQQIPQRTLPLEDFNSPHVKRRNPYLARSASYGSACSDVDRSDSDGQTTPPESERGSQSTQNGRNGEQNGFNNDPQTLHLGGFQI